jgi:hypothetical protein
LTLTVLIFAAAQVAGALADERPVDVLHALLEKCKTPGVYRAIRAMEKSVADRKAKADRATQLETSDLKRWNDCKVRPGVSPEQCAPLEDLYDHSKKKADSERSNWEFGVFILNQLLALPECPVETTPPPPPRPPPPVGNPTPAPRTPPPPVTVTHRSTNCDVCQPIANLLNEAADNYAAAVANHDPDQAIFRQQMAQAAAELDACEKDRCPPMQPYEQLSPLLPKPTENPAPKGSPQGSSVIDQPVFGPSVVPGQPSDQSNRRGKSEDEPQSGAKDP